MVVCAVLSVPARAQDVAEAQRLFTRGVALADAERWGEAAEYFRRARAIVERPSIVCNLGVALHHAGSASEASAALARCGELARQDPSWGEANAPLVERAAHLLAELAPARGQLHFTVEPPIAAISVDGVLFEGSGATRELSVDPGRHRVSISAPGFVTRTEEISVLSGASITSTYTLAPSSTPATLVVEAPADRMVRVDAAEVGRGHVELEVTPGAHEVSVGDDFERTIELGAGEHLIVDAMSHGTPIEQEPAFWIAIGGGVVVVAVAIILGVVLSQPTDPLAGYDGTTGIVLAPLVSF